MRHPLAWLFIAALIGTGQAANADGIPLRPTHIETIEAAVDNPARSAEARARDPYRHPVETLHFFEVSPDQTIVEVLPGGGWYTNILAPLLRGKGQYIALVGEGSRTRAATEELLEKHRPFYGETRVTTIDFATGQTSIPPASVDRILTFRNIHNLIPLGEDGAVRIFTAFFAALKPGGILGVVDHRLPESGAPERELTSGYVRQSTVIRLAEKAGFHLVATNEINANPKDRADWPDGVWTLPPTLKLGQKDRQRYLAIGESDRMTLKFVKPEPDRKGPDVRRAAESGDS